MLLDLWGVRNVYIFKQMYVYFPFPQEKGGLSKENVDGVRMLDCW